MQGIRQLYSSQNASYSDRVASTGETRDREGTQMKSLIAHCVAAVSLAVGVGVAVAGSTVVVTPLATITFFTPLVSRTLR